MRGHDTPQTSLFSFVDLEKRVPANHPLRRVRVMCDRALTALSPVFDRMYSAHGRPSIPPEHLLRALLLQVLYTVRSERMLMEQLDYSLLFRWFVGLGVDDPVWHPTTFTQNRDRLLEHEVSKRFFGEILTQAREAGLLSDEHFSVDGTFIEAWASQKSFKAKDGSDGDDSNQSGGRNPTVDFRGRPRSNETHASMTDPDCRLRRKSKGDGAKLVHHGHLVSENRHGLIVGATVTRAEGNAEVEAALDLLGPGKRRRGTVGGDKGFDQRAFIDGLRRRGMTPHVAQNESGTRSSTIDGRTIRHPGYAISQRRRKIIEEAFGWMKTVGLMRKVRHRGTALVGWMFEFTAAAYNLVRMRNLIPPAATMAAA